MSDTVITVENLSKRYLVGHRSPQREHGVTFREMLTREVKNFTRKTIDLVHGRQIVQGDEIEEFWALRDVSFEVKQGDVIGIIGHNGAGKSTLLKILTRITEPTEGRVTIRGRVASLLEVGTGFHSELTGRENIYLNGAILGMAREEIRQKFDEIVAFAEVESFLDTPVKRYSSGMYVRLAFAVAAHLEPEILIVDEVLAVGDAQFQKKCLARMSEVAKNGRTVLFVSHNMVAVRNLCSRAILLSHGVIAKDDESGSVITSYSSIDNNNCELGYMDLTKYSNRYGSAEVKILSAQLRDHNGNVNPVLQRLKPAALEFTLAGQSRVRLTLSAICMTIDGLKLLQLDHHDTPGFDPGVWNGCYTVRVDIPALPLQCGEYQWALGVHSESLIPIDVVLDVLRFNVEDDVANSFRPYRSVSENGFCSLLANWSVLNGVRCRDAVQ